MGCKMSVPFWLDWRGRGKEEEEEEPRQYSWDLARQTLDLSQFTIDKLVDGETGRKPGSISGQQFQIKNCNNCHIYLFDWSNTVTVDDCINCKIFIGPVKGSVFVRDCTNCVVAVACGQFRSRDCRNLDTFLCVNTQPIIESSSRVRVGCLQYNYPGLRQQMDAAEVTPWNNHWWNIHDFSPVDGGSNWSKLGRMFKLQDFLPLPEDASVKGVDVSPGTSSSVVPLTLGPSRERGVLNEVCLVMVFWSEQQEEVARAVVSSVQEGQGADLVSTCRMVIRREDAERVFGRWQEEVSLGPVISLQLSGVAALALGHQAVLAAGVGSKVGASGTREQGEGDLRGLTGLAQIHAGFSL